ncbi:hypothetical protein ACFL54_04860 [Planctomycetota bacterium]
MPDKLKADYQKIAEDIEKLVEQLTSLLKTPPTRSKLEHHTGVANALPRKYRAWTQTFLEHLMDCHWNEYRIFCKVSKCFYGILRRTEDVYIMILLEIQKHAPEDPKSKWDWADFGRIKTEDCEVRIKETNYQDMINRQLYKVQAITEQAKPAIAEFQDLLRRTCSVSGETKNRDISHKADRLLWLLEEYLEACITRSKGNITCRKLHAVYIAYDSAASELTANIGWQSVPTIKGIKTWADALAVNENFGQNKEDLTDYLKEDYSAIKNKILQFMAKGQA